MKPGKVLWCMFLLAVLGVDPVQNLAKYKKCLCVLIQLNNRSIAIMSFIYSLWTYNKRSARSRTLKHKSCLLASLMFTWLFDKYINYNQTKNNSSTIFSLLRSRFLGCHATWQPQKRLRRRLYYLLPLFQNEFSCKNRSYKDEAYWHENDSEDGTHFIVNGFQRGLVLTQR